MLIDSHCHLDAPEFDADRDDVAQAAKQAGVDMIVIPAVARENFQQVIDLSNQYTHCRFTLGIHPMYVDNAHPSDLSLLKALVSQYIARSEERRVGKEC